MHNRFLSLAIAAMSMLWTLALSAQKMDVAKLLRLPDNPREGNWTTAIEVQQPQILADIDKPVTLAFAAKGMTLAVVRCGNNLLTPRGIALDASGQAQMRLHPGKLPAGPVNLQIIAGNDNGQCDLFELQLWNAARKTARTHKGISNQTPPGAKGMVLDFAEDFEAPLSVSRDGRGTRWNAHKPTFGDFSGWPFSDPSDSSDGPFAVRDGYLIIQARKPEGSRGSTGLLASVDMDGKGYWAKAPFYMECRFMAHSAPGTWPAFWTVTNIHRGAGDELDVIEAYGGWGDRAANSTNYYTVTHYWDQRDAQGKELPASDQLVVKQPHDTSWSQAFHTYGVRVDKDFTTYYRDGIPVHTVPTNSYSYTQPHVVLLNYAIGGASGWHINLSRYHNCSNMYVDYVTVYREKNGKENGK